MGRQAPHDARSHRGLLPDCATHPALEGGRYFEDCKAVDPSADAEDAEVAARLWADTEAWVTA